MVYLEPRPWRRLAAAFRSGVDLVFVDVQNVPSQCWPPQAKLRSRLQYYLADRRAGEAIPGGLGLLPDASGRMTETSLAAAVLYVDGGLVVPDRTLVQQSITLDATRRLATDFAWQQADVRLPDLTTAEEILLLGTTGQIHAARRIDLRPHGGPLRQLPGVTGRCYGRLKEVLKEFLGVDFEAQALQAAP